MTDAYLRSFEAEVTDVMDGGLVLDRTAFYPAGGGQPSDTGMLESGDRAWVVTRVGRSAGHVVHYLDGDAPAVGSPVRGEIDWEQRYQLMRTHTALHILCGVIWRDYGAQVTGGNMKPLQARMDFELEAMSAEFAKEVEEKANREVDRALDVRSNVLPREEAFQIPDLIRTKINLLPPGIQEVRTIEIHGLDLQADGGTHVASTAEVGRIRVVGHESKGKINKRLRIALGP